MTKKIIFLAHQSISLTNFRKSLLKKLIENGFEVCALAPDFSLDVLNELKIIGVLTVPYSFNRTGMNPVSDLFNLIKLIFLLKKINPEIIFSYSIKPVIFGNIAAYFAGIRNRICMIEGLGYIFTKNKQGLSIFKKVLSILVKFLYICSFKKASKIIFLTSDDMNFFKLSNELKKKCFVLGGIGVDLDYWSTSPRLFVEKKGVTFVMVARLLREKGVYEYIQAISILRSKGVSARFILIGDVDKNPSSVQRAEVQNWVSQGLVVWPGYVDVKSWLESSDVFVLPSYREGLPRSTQEAMSMSMPVITTNVPGCKDTVRHGENGFQVPPFDAFSLSLAMKIFIDNPLLIPLMGEASRKIAVNEFDGLKKDQQLISLIEEVCLI